MIQLPQALIRAAINNVVETFATTPVTYHKASAKSLDRFGEGANKTPTNINLNGFVDYGAEEVRQNTEGGTNYQGVTIMFKAEDWETAGLYVNGEVKANAAKDHLTVNGKYYKVDNIMPDGAFETRNLTIVVKATLEVPKT